MIIQEPDGQTTVCPLPSILVRWRGVVAQWPQQAGVVLERWRRVSIDVHPRCAGAKQCSSTC